MRERYFVLDAVRGVAAIAVLILHYGVDVLSFRGYLAVDIFFVLSGFVIAHAYETKLRNGLSVRRFALFRAIRLYPLVIAAIAAAVAVGLLLHMLGREGFIYGPSPLLFGLLLLPYYVSANLDMFPVVSPTWSLFNELVINVAYAAVAPKLHNRVLVAVCVLSAFIILPATVIHGSIEFGPYRGTLLLGLVRTTFSFSAGVLLYRFRSSTKALHGPLPLLGAMAGTVVVVAAPKDIAYGGIYDAVAVGLVIPALLAFAAHIKVDGKSAARAALLGDLSYPIYLLHWPMRTALFASGISSNIPPLLFLTGSALLVCLCSYIALKLYDEPVRAALLCLASARKSPAHPVKAP